MTSKPELRAGLLAKRRALTSEDVAAATGAITAALLLHVNWESVKRAHVYTSLASWKEISTADLVEELQRLYPDITIDSSSSAADAPRPSTPYDVILVPTLGFDRRGYRIGLGKGWYDRFLAEQPQAAKIGLAYAWGEVAVVPEESHDVPLDSVLTEKELIVCD